MSIKVMSATLGNIDASVKHLLEESAKDMNIRSLAISITADSTDQIASIYNFMKDNMKYVYDPVDNDLFISPSYMVKQYRFENHMEGDCDDFALLTVALARSIGIISHVSIVDQTGKGYDHAIAELWSERHQRFIMVDPSTTDVPLGWTLTYWRKYDIA